MENTQKIKRSIIYREHESGEFVVRWPGVLSAILIYLMYTLGIPRLTQFAMMFSYAAGNPGVTKTELIDYLNSKLVAVNVITYVATAVILIAVYGRFLWKSLKELFVRMTLSRGLMFIWVPIVSVMFAYLGNYIVSIIAWLIAGNPSSANQETVVGMVSEVPLAMIFLTVIMAPIVEEIIFRAAWFRPLWFKSKTAAVVLTIVLFGFHHVWNAVLNYGDFSQLIMIITYIPSTIAIVFAHCMFKNIYGAMIAHMALNGFSMFMLLLIQPLLEQMEAAAPAAQESVGLVTELALKVLGC